MANLRALLTKIIVLASSFGLYAQDTIPAKKTLTDKIVSVFNIKHKKKAIFFAPMLSYAPTSGMDIGAYANMVVQSGKGLKARPMYIALETKYTTKHWFSVETELQAYPLQKYYLSVLAQFYRSHEKFYGVAQETPGEPDIFMGLTAKTDIDLTKRLGTNWYLGLRGKCIDKGIEGLAIRTDSLQGVDGGLSIGGGPFLMYDSRNNTFYPNKGFVLQLAATRHAFWGKHQKSGYYIFSGEQSFFQRLFGGIIMAQSITYTICEGNVPFYELPKIFGKNRLRGISNDNKFIGPIAGYGQIELRRPFLDWLGGVVFVGAGSVQNKLSEFGDRPILPAYGCGLRLTINKKDQLNARIDFGRGPFGDYGVYFAMKEAF